MKQTSLKEIKYLYKKANKFSENYETEKCLDALDEMLQCIKALCKEKNVNKFKDVAAITDYEVSIEELISIYLLETLDVNPTKEKASRFLSFLKALKKGFEEDLAYLDVSKAKAMYISHNRAEAYILLDKIIAENEEDIDAKILKLTWNMLEFKKEEGIALASSIEKDLDDIDDITKKIDGYEFLAKYYRKVKDLVKAKKMDKFFKEAQMAFVEDMGDYIDEDIDEEELAADMLKNFNRKNI
ncbi:MAG: hypothetical protein RSB87_06490 [Clostridia bacterium]